LIEDKSLRILKKTNTVLYPSDKTYWDGGIEIIWIIDLGYFRDILKLGQIGHGDSLPLGNRKHG